jgi:hypothetical protein
MMWVDVGLGMVRFGRLTRLDPNKENELTFLWIVLVVLYIALWVTLGMTTLRKGHTALFWFGIIFPVLWIVGAIMQPTPQVAAAQARANLQ